MSCNGFEASVVELARGELMEASARAEALRHAESCAACAARLTGEQFLTEALRAFTSSDGNQVAPARVESALLAALRENEFQSPLTAPARAHRFRSRRLLAAAAVVVVAVTLFVFAATRFERQPASIVASSGGTSEIGLPRSETKIETLESAIPQPHDVVFVPEKRIRKAGSPKLPARRPAPEKPPLRFNETMIVSVAGEAVVPASEQDGDDAGEVEGLTQFVPLNGDYRSAPIESGQLVRVQLNRASLASLGLPINAERAGETIKAEVLLGEDGIARALRLIR